MSLPSEEVIKQWEIVERTTINAGLDLLISKSSRPTASRLLAAR